MRVVRSTYGLGSAASEVYAENRSEDLLLLARESASTPARQYRTDDAWKGLTPASEALDVEVTSDPSSWTTPVSEYASWGRPNDSWVAEWNAITKEVRSSIGVRASNLVVGGLGVGVFLLGARGVGAALVGTSVLDLVAQKLSPAWARIRGA